MMKCEAVSTFLMSFILIILRIITAEHLSSTGIDLIYR